VKFDPAGEPLAGLRNRLPRLFLFSLPAQCLAPSPGDIGRQQDDVQFLRAILLGLRDRHSDCRVHRGIRGQLLRLRNRLGDYLGRLVGLAERPPVPGRVGVGQAFGRVGLQHVCDHLVRLIRPVEVQPEDDGQSGVGSDQIRPVLD
jgi:hypothetical protein